MRLFLLPIFLSIFACSSFAQTNCNHGDIDSLRQTWKSFRQASLHESPKEIAKYYKFPLKLLSPFDGEKPIRLSETLFLRDYRAIFQEIVPGEEVDLYTNIKKSTGKEYISESQFDKSGCRRPPSGGIRIEEFTIRIEDYNFIWSAKNGWRIASAYYSGQFDLLKRLLGQ